MPSVAVSHPWQLRAASGWLLCPFGTTVFTFDGFLAFRLNKIFQVNLLHFMPPAEDHGFFWATLFSVCSTYLDLYTVMRKKSHSALHSWSYSLHIDIVPFLYLLFVFSVCIQSPAQGSVIFPLVLVSCLQHKPTFSLVFPLPSPQPFIGLVLR